jgi:pimeloyl-ACP methyl ester carboxylesterase
MIETKQKIKLTKIVKTAFVVLLVVIVLPLASIASYEYLKVVFGPTYDAQKMPLNYEILGTGEKKLVLIHGLAGSLNYWKRDIDSISKTHQLLLVDLLGFGNSPKPKSDYSLSVQLEALEKIISKEGFDDGQTIVVGHSMGSIISLALLKKHPDWFSGAVVISTPVYSNPKEFKEAMSKNSLFDRLTAGPYSKFFCMLHPIYFVTNAFKPNNLTNDIFKDAGKHNWSSYYNSLNKIVLNTDLYALSKDLKDKKVIFIHGKKDLTAPFENALKLSKYFANSEFVVVNDGDHQLFLIESNLVWNIIQNF